MKSISRQLDAGLILGTSIAPYLYTMPKLRQLLSHRPLSEVDPTNTEQSVFRAVRGTCANASIATSITKLLLTHVRKKGGRLETMRANPLYVFSKHAYPVVEWTENDNSKYIAIFYIKNPDDQCTQCRQNKKDCICCVDQEESCVQCRLNWLVLSVIDTAENGEESRLNWSVSHPSHIRLLFSLAQHLFEVSKWSDEDKLNIYCLQNFEDCELTEYCFFLKFTANVTGRRDVPRC